LIEEITFPMFEIFRFAIFNLHENEFGILTERKLSEKDFL